MNLERIGQRRQQGAADVSSAELLSHSSAGKMPAAPWFMESPHRFVTVHRDHETTDSLESRLQPVQVVQAARRRDYKPTKIHGKPSFDFPHALGPCNDSSSCSSSSSNPGHWIEDEDVNEDERAVHGTDGLSEIPTCGARLLFDNTWAPNLSAKRSIQWLLEDVIGRRRREHRRGADVQIPRWRRFSILRIADLKAARRRFQAWCWNSTAH